MASIVFDEERSKCNLPTWRVQDSQYPGHVSLEATPWRGKFTSWLKGVAMPLPNFAPERAPAWEEFMSAKHYRTDGGTVSATGMFPDLINESSAVPITDDAELRSLYEDQVRQTRITEVDNKKRSVTWHLACDDSPGAMVWFSCFWEPTEAVDDQKSVKVTFTPSWIAQLRHWFSLKPWSITIHAPQAA